MKLHIHYCPVCDRMSGATFSNLPDIVNTMKGGLLCSRCTRDICETVDELLREAGIVLVNSLSQQLIRAERVFNDSTVEHSRRNNILNWIRKTADNREKRAIEKLRQELLENERNKSRRDQVAS